MALRLVQVDLPEPLADEAETSLRESGAAEVWSSRGGAFGAVVSAVMGAERTGAAVDLVYERLAARGELRAWLLDGAHVVSDRTLASGPVESVARADMDGHGLDDLLLRAPDGTASALLLSR